MGKWTTVFATASVIVVVVVVFEFFVFRTPLQQTTSVDAIVSNPSAWLNKTVVVEGNLSGPNILLAQLQWKNGQLQFSPWAYMLSSGSNHIGVYWSSGVTINGFSIVYGIVSEVTQALSFDPPNSTAVYYIEAEKIETS